MSQVISVRDLQEMVRNGQDVKNLPADAIITPSARDFLHELQTNGGAKTGAASPNPAGGDKLSPPAKKLNSKSPKSELEAFFNSPYAQSLKEQICEMGRRLWQREYVDGNGGNIAIRVGEDIAICTPTLVSKGSLKPTTCASWILKATSFAALKTHERNPHAPADHEAPAESRRDVPLPSALRHGFCGCGHRAADVHDSRI